MKDKLFQLLGVEHNEESLVSVLLVQSIFIGIFYGAFDISAHSLFLTIFDEKYMARAYVISGLVGIILTSLYTWLQARMQFRNFSILNFVFVSILTFLLWLFLLLTPSKGIIFFVFVMMGPLNILAMLCFWGTTGRLFSLRQGKRLFGLIDAGIIVGVIISSYMIPVILSFNFNTHNIILISSASVFVAGLLQVSIGNKYSLAAGQVPRSETKKPGLSVFRTNSYIRIMGIFIALSVITAFFVQYSFMAVTREQYPVESDMARFLGFFTGSMMIFTLLIKVLVFSYLIKNYGLRTCLTITPVLIAGFTAIAIGVGMTQGFTPAAGGFILFFLLLTLSRLFSKSLKDSLESPSFKVIYQTIDEKVRYEVQSGIDGTINEIAALSSGLLLSGLGALTFIRLIHFSWVLFFIIVIWAYFAIRLYSEYRNSIKKSLQIVSPYDKLNRKDILKTNPEGRFFLKWLLKSNYFNFVSGDTLPNTKVSNKWFSAFILDFALKRQDINLIPALKRISGDTNENEAIRHQSADIVYRLEGIIDTKPKSKLHDFKSTVEEKLNRARKILYSNRSPQTTEMLRILRDNSIESKRCAILAIGKFKIIDMLPEVCACLNVKGLEEDSYSVLESFGDAAIDEINRFYLRSTGNIKTSIQILKLLGKSGSEKNIAFLFSRLWSNSRKIKEVAAQCLLNRGYKATGEEKDRLHQLISDVIGLISWNIGAQICLEHNKDNNLLVAIKKETYAWNSFLFNLLSITYEASSVSKIRENLENGTVECVNYALEMIDIVIDDSIKPKLISLVDVVSDEEKLKNLHQFYPGEIPGYNQLIDDLINRDYNYIGIWARAVALHSLMDSSGKYESDSVIALLFSKELILREEAARLISVSNKDLYYSVSGRLSEENRIYLDRIMAGQYREGEYVFEKVNILFSCFPEILEDDLIFLAEELRFGDGKNLNDPSLLKDSILWAGPFERKAGDAIIITGNPEIKMIEKLRKPDNVVFYFLHLKTIEEYLFIHPEYSSLIFNYVDNYEMN
jgi:AAA family ATP:ADP antiporter